MKKLAVLFAVFFAVALTATSASAVVPVTWYDSVGFEPAGGYVLGPLPGQDGWLPDSTAGQSVPQVIADPTGLLSGQVAEFDAINGPTGWCGAYVTPGGDPRILFPGNPWVTVEWDQVRVDTDDNFWHTPDFAGWSQFGLQWDQTALVHSDGWAAGEPVGPVGVGVVDHIELIYSGIPGLTNITLKINGVNFGSAPTAGGTPVFIDWVFEIEDTVFGTSHGPLYMDNFKISAVPEPGTIAMLLSGLLGLFFVLRRRVK